MAEPSRKINKGQHPPALSVVSQGLTPPIVTREHDTSHLVFWSVNQDDPYLFNLTEFATGKTAADIKTGGYLWKGDFRGRPQLIEELVPVIRLLYGHNRAASLVMLQETLRYWWRVFDNAESPTAASGNTLQPVDSVTDLQILHHHIAKKMRVPRTAHNQFIRIANIVRSRLQLPLLRWPSIERATLQSVAPETWEVERIRREVKRQWFGALHKWKTADKTKANLWGWKATPHTERNIHAQEIYRAVIELTGHPLPSSNMVLKSIGLRSTPRWITPYSTPVSGLYPTCDDIRAAFVLCLMYSGWNISTLLNLNIEDSFVETHPTNPDYHIVYGFKERGQSEHYCIGRNKRLDAPGTILRTLVERSRPLRELVKKELAELDIQIAAGTASKQELGLLLKQRNTLSKRVRSPWLYADAHHFRVLHVNSDTVNQAHKSSYMRDLIHTINISQPPDKQIRKSIVLSDFRDSYVGFAYEFSNYNVLAAKIAAGHKQARTTQIYLRHKQWKAHSAKTIHKFQTAMFREIDERKSVDPTILRAHMEWETVTVEERARLAEYRKSRSRIGFACKDPTNPPRSIARNHTGGGCRIHRCTLCPQNALLLPDSYDGIAMRLAELEFLQCSIPVTSWVNSEFPQEIANAEAALKLYAPQRVEERLKHWREEINIGRHKPILFDGTY